MKRIGIISYEEFKERTLAIARGEYKPAPDDPKRWFGDLDAMIHAKNRLIDELERIFEALNEVEDIDDQIMSHYSLDSRRLEIEDEIKAIDEYLRDNK